MIYAVNINGASPNFMNTKQFYKIGVYAHFSQHKSKQS